MRAVDWPTLFPEQVLVRVSSLENGTIRHPSKDPKASANAAMWCQQLDVPLEQTVGVFITYEDERTYTDIVRVDAALDARGVASEHGWIQADALMTDKKGIALVLPVADCNAVVYYDAEHEVVALAHLGWHATVRDLAQKVVQEMSRQYGTRPESVLVYNSPSIRQHSYRFTQLSETPNTKWHQEPYAVRQPDGLYAIDLVQYNHDQWLEAGILPENIQINPVDTAVSEHYPSHRMGQSSRFAVLVMLQ